eukprot:CAMPEP_0206590828 /NCGR_PEP_ID=MMETSP0325_2-20121206/39869_1 /ASSEMBLY_ACC=CAM_ASM_000347 /TAXON_ID=2866 /ORGANISM="Crypthecodinium cohnii, Strain Seligo" /LENGTH=462 /DNA_ID=CAMNT_0054099889 /DNA_START=73 /DNA_END=1457 /DNA_ORIENTATION=-
MASSGRVLRLERALCRPLTRPRAWPGATGQLARHFAATPTGEAPPTQSTASTSSSSSSSSSAPPSGSGGSSSSSSSSSTAVFAGLATAALLGGGAGAYYFGLGTPQQVPVKVSAIDDSIFDTCDNLFLFFLDKSEDLLDRKEEIQKVCQALRRERSLDKVRFFFNVRKEGEPPIPPPSGALASDGPAAVAPLRCVMYKGQRKGVINASADDIPVQKVKDFYVALAETPQDIWKKLPVERVSGINFETEVIEKSNPSRPILVQLYEDTCFLCFLMRPFINSLSKMLKENGVPLTFKRLNIEKNDFPDKCPVARGTPTFVIYNGPEVPGKKWEEFKPQDLAARIMKEYPFLSERFADEVEELQGLLTRRFQLFTQMVMWTVEIEKLQKLIAGAGATAPPKQAQKSPEDEEESSFNAMVSEMMLKDMRRADLLLDNLTYLQKEVDEIEHDSVLLGVMLAEKVMEG